MRLSLQMALVAALFAHAPDAQAQMRFRGMDANNDGVISRGEWRGSAQSFRNQDWNGDGILSGDEVRTGASRQNRNDDDWNQDGRTDHFDRQIVQRFRGYDMDGDSRVAAREWPGDRRLFSRLDANRDGYVTMDEYMNGRGFSLDALGGPATGFATLDTNRDGWVTRSEWNLGNSDFDRLDLNRDNRINRDEFENDGNANGVSTNSGAWRTGYDRGVEEGQRQGRLDFQRNHGWDLDGQTELERADSGYSAQIGPLREYQSGYRDGFRHAYRMGFNNARDGR